MATLEEQLTALATMSPGQLRIEWRRAFRSSPPELTPDLMCRFIAWKLQVKAHGGLEPRIANVLNRIAAGGDSGEATINLKPGARIVREWNGRIIPVLVTSDGFSFEDRCYRSLSEIAREVTGAHWSGPRFFGLKRRRRSSANAS
jgi:hypothetical protein